MNSSFAASGLRIRLLEPSTGVVSGGTRVVIHGKGFRPQPHSLLVRFRLLETNTRLEVPGKFLLETQLECVVPSFQDDARAVIARFANLAPTSATVALAPHLVTLQVEVIVDSDRISNVLPFVLHQEIAIAKITPQFVLMTPPTTITATLNLLKLSSSSRLFPPKDKASSVHLDLAEISSLPVFVRVRQVSERTSAVSERTVEARWRISPVGVYEVEFDCVMMTFGDATVELTLNRLDYFRAKDKTPDAVGYCVHRDVTLVSVDPPCLSVNSGRVTEVRLMGEGFVDSGDLVVRLLQRDIHDAALAGPASASVEPQSVAQLTATYVNPNELRCSVHPNMSFGLTYVQVSLNGGRQFGRDRATALLHRDRNVDSIAPSFASLEGGTLVTIKLACLTVDEVDAPHQVLNLVPPRRVRIRFQLSIDRHAEGSAASSELFKVVNAEVFSQAMVGGTPPERGVIRCRVPSFYEEIKHLQEKHRNDESDAHLAVDAGRICRLHVSLALGGDAYFGSLPFGCFFPPIIQSITRHHGPRSGGTILVLRMKHRVPTQLAIQVRFMELSSREFEVVCGTVGSEYIKKHGRLDALTAGSPRRGRDAPSDDPAFVIVCTTPVWRHSKDGLVLSKVQVSMDGGFNFVPAEEEQELVAAGLVSPRSRGIPPQLVKDMSHLYFLFYPVPRLYSVVPMSADIQGGSFVRISGDHVMDHGGQISVVFQSPQLSRKVVGFIENGELRCCVPPYNVGPAIIFVSLNGEQYTKCEFIDPDSRRPIDFVYYSSPLLQRLSPLCACISHSSLIRIFGVNLIETGRVKVRFGFTSHQGKLVYKDVAARAEDGVIMAQSPLFGGEYANMNAVVDVALNGNDFSGKMLSLYYYSSYSIRRVDPPVGAFDIPIPLVVRLSQNIVSDAVLVRVRFKDRYAKHEAAFGPIPVTRWEGNRVEFTLPAIGELVESIDALEKARVDVSFDKSYFHEVGELLQHYQVYKLPPVHKITPLVGYFDQETVMVAKCSGLTEDSVVTVSLTLDGVEKLAVSKMMVGAGKQTPVVAAVVAETNAKKQTLSWKCPPLTKLLKFDSKDLLSDSSAMLLPVKLSMQISTINGQPMSLPFQFQYYRMPVLLSMSPQVGYICGGSLISFKFKEPIETPTVDFRFGSSTITGGRVRSDDKRLVECLSPELEAGVHDLAMSFDEQFFEDVYVAIEEGHGDESDEGDEDEDAFDDGGGMIPEESDTIHDIITSTTKTPGRVKGTFQAFAMPHFTIPANLHRVYAFGPLDGGSYVVIKGSGFIAEGKIYVRFCSSATDSLVGSIGTPQSEVIVKARVLDDTTILCASPPATRPGRVMLQVTYNLQQYTNSTCFFEYHERTTFASRGILCGPVSGGTPVCIQVEDPAGLPEDKGLLYSSCALRFTSEDTGHSEVVDASFDEESLTIQCIAPPWPSNELVVIEVTLSRDVGGVSSTPFQQYISSGVRFLFYDPPEGLITIEPNAGPISGGTEVLAWCGKIVDTGEIMVSVTLADEEGDAHGGMKTLASVGEDDGDEDEDDDEEGSAETAATNPSEDLVSLSKKEVHLVKGRIVGEAVSFIAPAVSKPGIAYLNIALNGINYTSSQTSTLRFKYYQNPVIRRITPAWCAMDSVCVVTISGDFIEDHGCKAVICFLQQDEGSDKDKDKDKEGDPGDPRILVEGTFVDKAVDTKSTGLLTTRALQCSFQAPHAGFFEIQVSLNDGQQFSSAKFMQAAFGNYSGSACTALLPFRCFSSPFLLATPTGSVAGGSTVTLFMNKRLDKFLSRESKCQVQFVPLKSGESATISSVSGTNASNHGSGSGGSGGGSPQKTNPLVAVADGVTVIGEIDHNEGKIICRAPLLRTPCTATIDILLPLSATLAIDAPAPSATASKTSVSSSATALISCAAFFNAKERERFYAYESPTITELAPTCGPLSGSTCIVIECSNIVDTGQIFVRFRSTSNERECVLVPATFSRSFPDGSSSASPLLVCQSPQVEVIERIIVSAGVDASQSSISPTRASSSTGSMTAKARAQSFQQLAEQSLRNGPKRNVLRVTRTVLKNAPAAALGGGAVSVLIDFTMNAGEQFIAHSVSFQFYPDLAPRELKWSPRHVPTRCFDRAAPSETRLVTVLLPKTLRSFTDSVAAAERVSFYFEGVPQQLFSSVQKRRGSSMVLHETGAARELLVLDAAPAAKLRSQSTMRRRSTFFRNSSISATSNNLLDSSGASLAANATRPRAVVAKGGGSSRRPSGSFATSAGGFSSTSGNPNTPSQDSSPSTGSSSPFIAAKIVKGGLELTCPVPEFSCAGSVQVFFSFNSQQFVCLGELQIHDPLTIREDGQHRFTSNIGGDRFVLYCSPSTIFTYLLQRDVLNEQELVTRQRRAMGLVRSSGVFEETRDKTTTGAACVVAKDGDPVSSWQNRNFYVVQVHLVPPNPALLGKVAVSASCIGSKAELATSSPDDYGCCVFEITDWIKDMLLSASISSTVSTHEFSSYSCVLSKSSFLNIQGNETQSSPRRMHALLCQLPTGSSGMVAVSRSAPGMKLLVIRQDGVLVTSGLKQSTSLAGASQYSHISFGANLLKNDQQPQRWWFVCMDLRAAGDSNNEACELHAAVADSSGVQVYLTGHWSAAVEGVWIIACVAPQLAGGFAIVEIDRVVGSVEEVASDADLLEHCSLALDAAVSAAATRFEELPKPTTVVTRVQFTCADSSRNLSTTADAQVILPGDHTLASFLETGGATAVTSSAPPTTSELQLQLRCDMPSLPFDGPTIISINVDGVIFSNSLCVHCYDPRQWRITRLDPPCGLLHKPLKLRIKGENFVDNKKTVVRISDATRYVSFAGTMERYRLLIVRIASVRNVRNLLPPHFTASASAGSTSTGGGSSPQRMQQQVTQYRGDSGTLGSSPFTLAVRVDYRDQTYRATSRESAVLSALASPAGAATSAVGWEDQFEVEVPADAMASALLVITLEVVELGANRSRWEVGRLVVPVIGLEDAGLTKRIYRVEEHFRWRASLAPSASQSDSEVDVFLHLSPLMTRSDVFVCDVGPFAQPQRLGVQISSGDGFFSPCPLMLTNELSDLHTATATSEIFRPIFQAYRLPVVTDTKPQVLPRTAGGEIVITGEGFVDCGESSGQICVRLFCCLPLPTLAVDENNLLRQINATASIQPTQPTSVFVRDVVASFVSSTSLRLMLPPRLASYKIYYRVSMDGGLEFSEASTQSRVMLYSADTVEPKGGPVSGNTYVAIHGTNLSTCMGIGDLTPLVRLTWMRGIKELEHVVVRGEFYPPEDIVYFYTPQSKFGLQNITVHIEVALASTSCGVPASDYSLSLSPAVGSATINMVGITAAFGQDEIPFVIYRTPTIKSITPLHGLVCGLSAMELLVQGLDEKATVLLKSAIKARFKRRGQMQIADVQMNPGAASSDGKLLTIVPRFVVGSAVATDVVAPTVATPSPPTRISHVSAVAAAAAAMRNNGAPLKVWTRQGAIYVLLLRARDLFVGKKTSTCNPFAIIQCDKAQLKSARKDGTSSPVWNELFDFDWRKEKELPHLIRISIENQISSDQSELLGQVQIKFADSGDLTKPFCARAWFPLRKVTYRGTSTSENGGRRVDLGDIEVVIAYIPVPAKKVVPSKLLHAATLKSSIMSAMRQKKATATTEQQPQQRQETPRARRERILRAFRRQGAPPSLAPSELIVELAVNGQDFWSGAPSRCFLVPTPIVLSAEPSFISMGGGTPLTISGMNFVPSGVLRVAFAVVASSNPVSPGAPRRLSATGLDSKRIAVVEAKYRSNHCVSCVTPPLKPLSATEASIVNIYITINGLDFDSVGLPLHSYAVPADDHPTSQAPELRPASRPASTPERSVVDLVGGAYVINQEALLREQAHDSAVVTTPVPTPYPLLHRVSVYLRPIIQRVIPADGVYTSLLVVEGREFSHTGIAVARYCSKLDTQDIRTAPVRVVSSERMECAMPDFPRGTVVTMSIAMNGIEFVACPGDFAVFQSPRLTEIVPNWISTASSNKQDVRLCGVNLTTNISASGAVQVSFSRDDVTKTIKGQCVDGEVLCSVPRELMGDEEDEDSTKDLVLSPSIWVDVWLGGTHKTFTGSPVELHLYRTLPEVATIAPMNGPIYGGYIVTIEGSGFVDTGRIVARFQAFQEAPAQRENDKSTETSSRPVPTAVESTAPEVVASAFVTFVDASARFVSADKIVCDAPSFPQEGVYSVSVALNGVEFDMAVANQQPATWFLVWQNWQRRKQLMAQRMSLELAVAERLREAEEREALRTPLTASNIPVSPSSALLMRPPSTPRTSNVEMAFGRRVPSRVGISGADDHPAVGGTQDSPRRRQQQQRLLLEKMVEDESLEHVEDHFVDMRLLQWHPATTDEKSRSLLALLTDLLNSPETQQIIIRRVGFVFRMRGSRDASSGQFRIDGSVALMQALKLIFPHAPEKQFDELGLALDPSQLGFVSLHTIIKRLVATDTPRPQSPEPGPTHYNPSYTIVEPKPPVPVILPQSTPPDPEESGLPSELFMNYEAFKAVRPRVKGGIFPKRKFSASWCNPVPKETLFQVETDEEIERTFTGQQTRAHNSMLGLGSLASSETRHITPRPPPSGSGSSSFAVGGGRSNWKPSFAPGSTVLPGMSDSDTSMDSHRSGKRDAISSDTNNHTTKLISPRVASPASVTSTALASMRRFSASNNGGGPGGERSILHDDIAPLYLKFLRSKEVQKGKNNALE